jgi:hypothetical protein
MVLITNVKPDLQDKGSTIASKSGTDVLGSLLYIAYNENNYLQWAYDYECPEPMKTSLWPCTVHIECIGSKIAFSYISLNIHHIVTYQDSPVTQQMNGASLLYSLVSATMKTNASS